MQRRLILLTARYPLNVGDASFVRHEIGALAERFDEILVFNCAPSSAAELVELPANVRYVGNLYDNSRLRAMLHLFIPRVMKVCRAVLREARQSAPRRPLMRALLDCYLGIKLSANPELHRAVKDRSAETTVYSFWGMGGGLALPWLPRVNGTVNLRLHRYDFHEETSRRLPYRRTLYRSADRILPVSEFAIRYLSARYADIRIAEKLRLSRLGTTDPGAQVRSAPTQEKLIVSCSHVIPLKRVDRIVDALALLSREGHVRWVHFGGGEGEQLLRQKVAGRPNDSIRMEIRGMTLNADVLQFYRENRVDAFVNVSTIEGVPVSVMEAMSFGIPVIATDVGGTAEVVASEFRSGELIPADFTDGELAQAIDAVLSAEEDIYDPRRAWAAHSDALENARHLASILVERLASD